MHSGRRWCSQMAVKTISRALATGAILVSIACGSSMTAPSQVGAASSSCVAPLTLPDKWIEHFPTTSAWTTTSVFDRYVLSGPGRGTLLSTPDVYDPQGGFGLADAGIRLQIGSFGDTGEPAA